MSTPTYKPIELPETSSAIANDPAQTQGAIFKVERVESPAPKEEAEQDQKEKQDNKIRISLSCVDLSALGSSVSGSGKKKNEEKEASPTTVQRTEPKIEVIKLSKDERRKRIERYLLKKQKRKWNKEVVYYSRQRSAEKRVRVCGRFVNKATEIIVSQKSHKKSDSSDRCPTMPSNPATLYSPQVVLKSAKPDYTETLPVVNRPIFSFIRSSVLHG